MLAVSVETAFKTQMFTICWQILLLKFSLFPNETEHAPVHVYTDVFIFWYWINDLERRYDEPT